MANGNVQQLAREIHDLIFREALSEFHQPTFVCNLHLLYPPFNLWPEARSLPCPFAPFSPPTELIPDQRWSTQRSWPSSAPWAYVLGAWPHDSTARWLSFERCDIVWGQLKMELGSVSIDILSEWPLPLPLGSQRPRNAAVQKFTVSLFPVKAANQVKILSMQKIVWYYD